jgi:hypothetical protein
MQNRLASATGRLKQAVDEAVREIQAHHPKATREGILEHLESAGFDETDWYPPHLQGVTWDKPQPSPPPSQRLSTKR